MGDNRVLINKADDGDSGDTIFRLTQIEPQFVSLVTAGANRQRKFQVVKADDGNTGNAPNANGSGDTGAGEGDANNHNGTNSSAKGQGGDSDFAAWLEEQETSIDGTLEEAQMAELLMNDDTDEDPPPAQSVQQPVGKSVDKMEKALSDLQVQLAVITEKKESLEAQAKKDAGTIQKLKKQLGDMTTERNKYRTRVSTLKQSVGGTTALQTGNVGKSAGNNKEVNDPVEARWAAGGDLAAKATAKQ